MKFLCVRHWMAVGLLLLASTQLRAESFYATLGVQTDANTEAIKKAYRKLAIKYHPDKNPGDEIAADKFRAIGEAYDVLGDEEKRSNYDKIAREIQRYPSAQEYSEMEFRSRHHAAAEAVRSAQAAQAEIQAEIINEAKPSDPEKFHMFAQTLEGAHNSYLKMDAKAFWPSFVKNLGYVEKLWADVVTDTTIPASYKKRALDLYNLHYLSTLLEKFAPTANINDFLRIAEDTSLLVQTLRPVSKEWANIQEVHRAAMFLTALEKNPGLASAMSQRFAKQHSSFLAKVHRRVSVKARQRHCQFCSAIAQDAQLFARVFDDLRQSKRDAALTELMRLGLEHAAKQDLSQMSLLQRNLLSTYLNRAEDLADDPQLKKAGALAYTFLQSDRYLTSKAALGERIPFRNRAAQQFWADTQVHLEALGNFEGPERPQKLAETFRKIWHSYSLARVQLPTNTDREQVDAAMADFARGLSDAISTSPAAQVLDAIQRMEDILVAEKISAELQSSLDFQVLFEQALQKAIGNQPEAFTQLARNLARDANRPAKALQLQKTLRVLRSGDEEFDRKLLAAMPDDPNAQRALVDIWMNEAYSAQVNQRGSPLFFTNLLTSVVEGHAQLPRLARYTSGKLKELVKKLNTAGQLDAANALQASIQAARSGSKYRACSVWWRAMSSKF